MVARWPYAIAALLCSAGLWAAQAFASALPPAKPAPAPASTDVGTALSAAKASANRLCWQQLRALKGVSALLCQQSGLQASGALSVQGRPILLRDLPAAQGIHKPTRVLVIGGIHGDEPSATVLALHWIELAKQIPAQSHWRFLPALNPDGLLAQKPTRTNARGVDLNRNFPTPNWQNEASAYWGKRTKKDPRRWPGEQPLSEPESKLVFDQMASFAPQLIVSIHAPYGVLDFDGPSIPPDKLGRLYLDQIGIYPGSLGSAAETRQMWLDLLRWMSSKGF